MPTGKQKRIKRRLDRRQKKVDESRATFGTNDPDLGKFDRRLNRLKRTVNKAEKQGMDVNYDTRNASGEGAVKTTIVKPKKGSATQGSKYGYGGINGTPPTNPLQMESAKQEKKNLLKDMPIDDKASALEMGYKMSAMQMGHEPPLKMGPESPMKMGGSWMSKHSKSALHMGHSPAEMGHSPLEGHCMGKRK